MDCRILYYSPATGDQLLISVCTAILQTRDNRVGKWGGCFSGGKGWRKGKGKPSWNVEVTSVVAVLLEGIFKISIYLSIKLEKET